MKKQLVLLLALSTILMTACDDNDYIEEFGSASDPSAKIIISSIFPESAVWGSAVTIFGENFGATISDNYVTFGGAYAEIIEVQRGIVVVRIPMNLTEGDYSINLSAQGQTATSTHTCKVSNK